MKCKIKPFLKNLVLLCIVLGMSGLSCAAKQNGVIEDLNALPQDAGIYLKNLDSPVLHSKRQAVLYQDFTLRFFSPWHRSSPKHTADQVFFGLAKYSSKEMYGENNLKLAPNFLDTMARKSQPAAYPLMHLPAITVVHASIRVFPTHKPVFSNPLQPSRGFPFDQMQNSLVSAGTPLLITHVSKDKQWFLVETDAVAGWIRWRDIAIVDQQFISEYMKHPLAGFVADQVPVTGLDDRFLFSGRVGMALPVKGKQTDNGSFIIMVPERNHLGRAKLLEAKVSQKNLEPLPLAATPENFTRIVNALLGQTYGWGGLYENRDCSAFIQDVFASFGIQLPRNSKDQAGAGHFIPFERLSGREKQNLILDRAIPLLTILYMPGHVMLFLGQDPASGHAVVCHAMWGITTRSFFKTETGRHIIGRTVITSLEPGKELFPLVRQKDLLVEKLTGMVLFK